VIICDSVRAYRNEYWNDHEQGIYVDVVSGEPLFSSVDKYDSETGRPSFTNLLETSNEVTKSDSKFFIVRSEVRSKEATRTSDTSSKTAPRRPASITA